jgi:hypothetical protein
LRQPYGEEIMAIQFTTEGCKRLKYRKTTAHFFSGSARRSFASAQPRVGALGNWSLDMGGRFALPSHKNLRLEGECGGPIYVRKYRSGGLEVQTGDSAVSPLCLFALAIASFVARK